MRNIFGGGMYWLLMIWQEKLKNMSSNFPAVLIVFFNSNKA